LQLSIQTKNNLDNPKSKKNVIVIIHCFSITYASAIPVPISSVYGLFFPVYGLSISVYGLFFPVCGLVNPVNGLAFAVPVPIKIPSGLPLAASGPAKIPSGLFIVPFGLAKVPYGLLFIAYVLSLNHAIIRRAMCEKWRNDAGNG